MFWWPTFQLLLSIATLSMPSSNEPPLTRFRSWQRFRFPGISGSHITRVNYHFAGDISTWGLQEWAASLKQDLKVYSASVTDQKLDLHVSKDIKAWRDNVQPCACSLLILSHEAKTWRNGDEYHIICISNNLSRWVTNQFQLNRWWAWLIAVMFFEKQLLRQPRYV